MTPRLFATSVITLLSLALPVAAQAATPALGRPARDVLAQSYAAHRAQQVSHVAYTLAIDLQAGKPTYGGTVDIRFVYARGSGDVTVDYAGKQVRSLMINGKATPIRYNKSFLVLPASALQTNNLVRIGFSSEFDTTGVGFTRFVDPIDGKTYLNTDFEPYGAHRLFPCFDQPDLKAPLTLTVTAPKDWVVIANAGEQRVGLKGNQREYHFLPTKPISPYLYALHAGHYVHWHDKAGAVPLGLYARASLAKHVDTATLFDVTRRGLAFYNGYFDTAYPFAKYDQIFVPELAESAMENVGAVTLAESMIFRHQVTDRDRFDRDATILHEMAHMWFGNLVTMRWWNDLWLNESFASYMEGLSKEAVPRYGDAWMGFYLMKEWGYDTDERITTHPIEANIPDTDAAFENFDGITYGKGASAMKQLAYAIGPDAFRDGVRRYFKQHAFANTTLADFMGALQTQTPQDLSVWTQEWLRTPGLNTLTANWQSDKGRISAFSLLQGVASGPAQLRSHRTTLAFYRRNAKGELQLDAQLPVSYSGVATAVSDAVGRPSPDFVFANLGDQDYSKLALDPVSLKTAQQDLSRIPDAFVRQQLWTTLWTMVRDRKLDVPSYLALLQAHLPLEGNASLIETQIKRLKTAYLDYLSPADRRTYGGAIEDFAWSQLSKQGSNSDGQLVWASALISVSRTPNGLQRLHKLLQGSTNLPGLTLNQDLRWQIVQTLAASGWSELDQLVAAERRRDPSDRGLRSLEWALAARPTAQAKSASWTRFLTDRKTSLSLLSSAMNGFHGFDQEALLQPYVGRYFETLLKVTQHDDAHLAKAFSEQLFPEGGGLETVKRTSAILARKDLPATLRKTLMEAREDLERRLAIQSHAHAALVAAQTARNAQPATKP